MIKAKQYIGDPGNVQITDPELMYVTILGVKREGVGYTQVDTLPNGREFYHDIWGGFINFDLSMPFIHNPTLGSPYEQVWVLFKY